MRLTIPSVRCHWHVRIGVAFALFRVVSVRSLWSGRPVTEVLQNPPTLRLTRRRTHAGDETGTQGTFYNQDHQCYISLSAGPFQRTCPPVLTIRYFAFSAQFPKIPSSVCLPSMPFLVAFLSTTIQPVRHSYTAAAGPAPNFAFVPRRLGLVYIWGVESSLLEKSPCRTQCCGAN